MKQEEIFPKPLYIFLPFRHNPPMSAVKQTAMLRAVNSAGECHLDVVEVIGSNPIPPNRKAF